MHELTTDDPLAARQVRQPSLPEVPGSGDDYDVDFLLWLNSQVAALRARQFEAVDLDNVIEELESMGKRDQRELSSRLETLLMHLLKCEFQPEKKCGSWLSTLREQRSRISDLLQDSPSLANRVVPVVADRFEEAVARAALGTDLAKDVFPDACPYTPEQVLDVGFIP